MAVTCRERMLAAIRKDDFEKFSLILTEFQDNLQKLEDSRGKNFFHDLCENTIQTERVQVYFHQIQNYVVYQFLSLHQTLQL